MFVKGLRTLFYTAGMPTSSKREQRAGQPRPAPVTAGGPAALPAAPPRVARRRPAAGRKPTLSVPVIVAAAIEVLDEAGYAGLTMRRVADRLGTGAASLYAHVSGREELLELVFDALVGQVKLEEPDPARWREQVHRLMRDLRDILASHTDAALAGLGRVPTTPQTLAAAEVLTGVLRAADCPTGSSPSASTSSSSTYQRPPTRPACTARPTRPSSSGTSPGFTPSTPHCPPTGTRCSPP